MSDDMLRVSAGQLRSWTIERLTEVGMNVDDAAVVADVVVYADLRGVHSHGVLRVEHYTKRIRAGGMNLKPKLEAIRVRPSVLSVDAQGGPGHVATKFAMGKAIPLAREHGITLVGIRNNSHCGALAYYVQMALDEHMSCMVGVNTDMGVVPYGGRAPFFGTNPFAFGFPGSRDSILLDMATSEVAFGKIYYAREKGEAIPASWAVDAEGRPCTDPWKAKALLPFGGPKGYGVAMMVEALTGLLIGGVFGPHLNKMYGDLERYRDLSTFLFVFDPAAFGPPEALLERTQAMVDELRGQPVAPGFDRVMIPGEREQRTAERYREEGIPLARSIVEFLSGGATIHETNGGNGQ